jgi:hypothetical protein
VTCAQRADYFKTDSQKTVRDLKPRTPLVNSLLLSDGYALEMKQRKIVTFELGDRKYTGEYEVAGDMLYVYFDQMRKADRLGGLKHCPETLARHLLLDLAHRKRIV